MYRQTDPIELTARRAGFLLILAATAVLGVMRGQEDVRADLEGQFTKTVRPFLEMYCIGCHGQQRPAAQMDLSAFRTMAALTQDERRWVRMLERLEAEEMPPKGARHPTPQERHVVVDWFMPSAKARRAAMPAIQGSCWRGGSAMPSTTTRSAI